MGIFNDLDSILGLISVILQFMPIFLRLCLVLLVQILIADLRFSSQMLGESREIEAKPSQERLQKRLNRTKTEDVVQNLRTKKKHKMQRSETNGAD